MQHSGLQETRLRLEEKKISLLQLRAFTDSLHPLETKSVWSRVFCSRRSVLVTCSILEMSQGRAPLWASSTIFCLVESGSGLPLTNTPPSWFTPLWPTWRQKHQSHRTASEPPMTTCVRKQTGFSLNGEVKRSEEQELKMNTEGLLNLTPPF